jgi:hypothetical protein
MECVLCGRGSETVDLQKDIVIAANHTTDDGKDITLVGSAASVMPDVESVDTNAAQSVISRLNAQRDASPPEPDSDVAEDEWD